MKHFPSNSQGEQPFSRQSVVLLASCLAALLALMSAMSALPLVAGESGSKTDHSAAAPLLLLKNGNLLAGHITREGDYYYVVSPGGKLRVRASEAVAICHDVAEAYRLRRQALQPTVVYDYLELANWCIRHRLYEQAAIELQQAEQADPGHPRIALLRKRLELAQHPVASANRSSAGARRGPTVDELEKMVRSMPPGTVEYFAGRIQPLLVNSCATSACHGPEAASRFRLTRIPSHRPPSRRVTQRNLYNTLQWIDNQHPAKSPLLTVPTRPHGPTRIVLFSDTTTRRYQQLVAWVYSVTQQGGSPVSPLTMPLAGTPPAKALPTSRGYQALQQPANPTEATSLQQAIYEGRQGATAPLPPSGTVAPVPQAPRRFAPASMFSAASKLESSSKKGTARNSPTAQNSPTAPASGSRRNPARTTKRGAASDRHTEPQSKPGRRSTESGE